MASKNREKLARRQKIKEKEKEIKDKEKEIKELKKEELLANWHEYKTRIYLSFERVFIATVSFVIFVLHCVHPPDEDSSKSSSLMDRGLTPMAYGGDCMVQFGLFVACAAFLYAHPGLLLLIDAATAALIVLEFCLNWPGAFYGAVLAIYLLSILDIILHTLMVGKAIMSIKLYQKRKSLEPQSHYAEPEGWSWGMGGPHYSSAASWSGKSRIPKIQESSRKSSLFAANRPAKKSLLSRARDRMNERKASYKRPTASQKAVLWETEPKESKGSTMSRSAKGSTTSRDDPKTSTRPSACEQEKIDSN